MRTFSKEVIRKMVKASAALEGRVVPEGFVRSDKVQKFLDSRKK